MSTKDGYAVLGSDGMSIVVFGVGDTEDDARGDWANWAPDVSEPTETVKITAAQRERIEAGDLYVEDLELLTRDEARGVAYRLGLAGR